MMMTMINDDVDDKLEYLLDTVKNFSFRFSHLSANESRSGKTFLIFSLISLDSSLDLVAVVWRNLEKTHDATSSLR